MPQDWRDSLTKEESIKADVALALDVSMDDLNVAMVDLGGVVIGIAEIKEKPVVDAPTPSKAVSLIVKKEREIKRLNSVISELQIDKEELKNLIHRQGATLSQIKAVINKIDLT